MVDSNSTFLAVMNQHLIKIGLPVKASTVALSSNNKIKEASGAHSQTPSSRDKTSGNLPARNSPVMTDGHSKMLRSSSSQATVNSSNRTNLGAVATSSRGAMICTTPLSNSSNNNSTLPSSRTAEVTSLVVVPTRLVNVWNQATNTQRLTV